MMKCLKRALARRKPLIINSDQSCHFTNSDYLALLKNAGVKASMDGKGRATDNAWSERFFRTLKYDCVYIYEFETPRQLKRAIDRYVTIYNCHRPCQAIGYEFPADIYQKYDMKIAA